MYENYEDLPPPVLEFLQVPTEESENSDLEAKSEICARIFNSSFFDMQGEKAVRFGPGAMNQDIYKQFYEDRQNASRPWMNPYNQRIVSIGDVKLDEYVFKCVTRKRKTSPALYNTYFISPHYQSWLDDLDNTENLFMNGRFIFISNKSGELTVYARAEASAIIDEDVIPWTLENYFLWRKYKQPGNVVPQNG